jgi:hypothetical protein
VHLKTKYLGVQKNKNASSLYLHAVELRVQRLRPHPRQDRPRCEVRRVRRRPQTREPSETRRSSILRLDKKHYLDTNAKTNLFLSRRETFFDEKTTEMKNAKRDIK